MSDTNKERASQSVAAMIIDKTSTYLHANLHAAVMKEFTLEAEREEEDDNWHIRVSDEGGYYLYDGYWQNSSHKTISQVLVEAVHGSMLDRIASPPSEATPLSTPTPQSAGVTDALQELVNLRNKDRGSWTGAWASAWEKAESALRGE